MKKIDGWVTTPQGFLAAGVKAGIKASGNHDVAVIYSTVPAATGAVFTQNKMCAAPVLVSRKVAAKSYAQAIVVNSGCRARPLPNGLYDGGQQLPAPDFWL